MLGDVQSLPNGNVLITGSTSGQISEVTTGGQAVASFKFSSVGYSDTATRSTARRRDNRAPPPVSLAGAVMRRADARPSGASFLWNAASQRFAAGPGPGGPSGPRGVAG